MASPNSYNPGGTSGARLATRAHLTSGRVWYVCNAAGANGADGAGTAGLQRTRPLVTTDQAVTNATAGDTIQFLAGHVETVTSTITANKALHFYSEGTPATRAVLQTSSAVAVLTLSASGIWTENITFKISGSGVNCIVTSGALSGIAHVDCSFEGNNATASGLVSWASAITGGQVSGCTFTSTATSIAARPAYGWLIGATPVDTTVTSCTFSGGSSSSSYYGWATMALEATAAVTRFNAIDVDLLLDSDAKIATGSVYRWHTRNTSGSSWVELVA